MKYFLFLILLTISGCVARIETYEEPPYVVHGYVSPRVEYYRYNVIVPERRIYHPYPYRIERPTIHRYEIHRRY